MCQFCTYLNYSPATVCEMCDLARPEPAPLPVKLRPPSPVRRVPALPIKPKEPAPEDQDVLRQRMMKEDGLKLIQLIRASHLHHLSLSWALHYCTFSVCIIMYMSFMSVSGWGEERSESRRGVHKHESSQRQQHSALQVVKGRASSAIRPDPDVGGNALPSVRQDHNRAHSQYASLGTDVFNQITHLYY